MADGTFAVLMLVFGFADMSTNYCATGKGCLGRTDQAPRLSVSLGRIIERQASSGEEIYARYDLNYKNGPFGHALGFSIGDKGAMWLGMGQTYFLRSSSSPVSIEMHAMTGLYEPGGGINLGGPIQFRSGIQMSYESNNGWSYGLGYDHRSNMEIYKENPGVETFHFRITRKLRK